MTMAVQKAMAACFTPPLYLSYPSYLTYLTYLSYLSYPPLPHLLHRRQEVRVGLRLAHLVEEQFHRLDRRQRREHLPQHPDAVEIVFRNQQLFLARAGLDDVDRREHALVHELAVKMDFHVARALELFEDHIVHARAGVDERGGHDRDRAALFDVACGAEEALRLLERVRVETA